MLPFLEPLSWLLLGVVTGAYGTIVGIGGGFIAVPALSLLYRFPSYVAAGTSLVMVFFNAGSATIAHFRQRHLDFYVGVRFALTTMPGAVAGAYMSKFFHSSVFNTIFGVILLLVGVFVFMEIRRPITTIIKPHGVLRTIVDDDQHRYEYRVDMRLGYVISFLTGFISSIFGVGGGIIHVPTMVALLGIPVRIATATSQFILLITVATGAISHLALGHVHYASAIPLGLGAIIGAQFGARSAKRLRGKAIQKLVSFTLLILGAILVVT